MGGNSTRYCFDVETVPEKEKINAFELFKKKGYLHAARKTKGYMQMLDAVETFYPVLYEGTITRDVFKEVADKWNTTVYNIQRNIKKVAAKIEPEKDYLEFMLEMAYELEKENRRHGN